MIKCDVVVTYTWNRVGYNILMSLAKKGIRVVVGDTTKHTISSKSRYAADAFIYADPFKDETKFINDLLEAISYYRPKVLIPTHDEGVIIAKYIDRFPSDLIIPIESYEKILNISDKKKASYIAGSVKVPIPEIYDSVNSVNKYPCVFKTTVGNSAKDVYFPKDKNELIRLTEKYKDREIIIQEKIEGTDHSVDCIRYKNFFYASVYRALVTKTDGGGTTTQRIIVDAPLLVEYAKRILDSIDYNGVCGLDFRYDPQTNKSAFIEVNARYTGGLATPIAAGFDIPYIHYQLALHGKYLSDINLKIGTKSKWILGDIITLVTRIVGLKLSIQELKDILNFRFDCFDDFDSSDKLALCGEFQYYISKLIKNKKLNP